MRALERPASAWAIRESAAACWAWRWASSASIFRRCMTDIAQTESTSPLALRDTFRQGGING